MSKFRPPRRSGWRAPWVSGVLAVLIAAHVSQDGESTWFEGVQLLAVYVVLGIVFYFV